MHRDRNDSYVTAVIPLFGATGLQIKHFAHKHIRNFSAVKHQQFDRLSISIIPHRTIVCYNITYKMGFQLILVILVITRKHKLLLMDLIHKIITTELFVLIAESITVC